MTSTTRFMKPVPWRLFRHEAGRVAGPPAWAYLALFAVCQLAGFWMAQTFSVTILWPANAVLVAALLQLPRKQAVQVMGRRSPSTFWAIWCEATQGRRCGGTPCST